MDCEGHQIFLDDIVLLQSFEGCTKPYIDVGIVKYNNLSCSFYIKCKYINIEFTPFLYLKILDKVENHINKTELEILELYQGQSPLP